MVPAAQFDWINSGLVNPLDCKYFFVFPVCFLLRFGSPNDIPILDILCSTSHLGAWSFVAKPPAHLSCHNVEI